MFGWPNPDPVTMDYGSGWVDPNQPIMDRLMPLGIAACEFGAGLEFAAALAIRIWSGKEGWYTSETLASAAREVGLDLVALDQWIAENATEASERLAENEAAQLKHHWGVPLMVLDDEPFFGQDRIEALVWRLNQRGLRCD